MKNSNSSFLVNENWDTVKIKLQTIYPVLKDSDLQYLPGNKNEMLNKIQSRLGKTREELSSLIATL
jgi:hypothetical protein